MVLSTQLGNAAAGAFQAMLSVHNIAFALSMGFGSAAGVRVGNAVGRGRARPGLAARDARRRDLPRRSSAASRCRWCSPRRSWSGPSPTIRRCGLLAASMLAIIAAFLVFDGLQFVFASALRSLGRAGLGGGERHHRLLHRHRRARRPAGRARLGRGRARLGGGSGNAGLRGVELRPALVGAQPTAPKFRVSVRPPCGTPISALSKATRPPGWISFTGGAIDQE